MFGMRHGRHIMSSMPSGVMQPVALPVLVMAVQDKVTAFINKYYLYELLVKLLGFTFSSIYLTRFSKKIMVIVLANVAVRADVSGQGHCY